MSKRNSAIVLAFLAASLSTPALADEETGGYFGIGAGVTMADMDGGAIDADLATLGLTTRTTVDDQDFGFKVFGGYRFNRNIAIEGAYTNFGKFSSHTDVLAGGSGTGKGEWTPWSLNVSGVGIIPLGETFEIFGRAGASFWNLDFDFTASGPGGTGTASESSSGVSGLLGAGVAINFGRRVALRAEYERHFDVGDDDTGGSSDLDMFSASMVFRF